MANVIETSQIRKGLKVVLDNNEPFTVVDFQFVKPGKGNAFTRTRMKSLITGNVIERTYKTGEKLQGADLEDRRAQYLYKEGEDLVLMDTETYDQHHVPLDVAGDTVHFLKENTEVSLLLFDGRPISVELPNFVELLVTDAGAGAKGDRATAATKDATLETGYVIQVPLFINEGDLLRIDTRTGEYVERAKK
jgi:elongation factor P